MVVKNSSSAMASGDGDWRSPAKDCDCSGSAAIRGNGQRRSSVAEAVTVVAAVIHGGKGQ